MNMHFRWQLISPKSCKKGLKLQVFLVLVVTVSYKGIKISVLLQTLLMWFILIIIYANLCKKRQFWRNSLIFYLDLDLTFWHWPLTMNFDLELLLVIMTVLLNRVMQKESWNKWMHALSECYTCYQYGSLCYITIGKCHFCRAERDVFGRCASPRGRIFFFFARKDALDLRLESHESTE